MYVRNKTEASFLASMYLYDPKWLQIETATHNEDVYKHWDVKVNGLRYDVKAAKRIQRTDPDVQYDYTWVELRNVKGLGGWLVGEADYIVFELEKEFILVDRMDLFQLVTANIKPVVGAGPYERYQREDRGDLLTLVPINDLRNLGSLTIPKFIVDEC